MDFLKYKLCRVTFYILGKHIKTKSCVFKCWPISDGFKMAEEIANLGILNRARCIGFIRNLLCMFSIPK